LIGGVSPQGTHYYPALPYPSYTGMRVEDVNDLMAYLRTLPPVTGRAPPHSPLLLFRIRRFVGFWKLLFFREGHPFYEPAVRGPDDRGAYLVESVAHCAECHSERNILGAVKPPKRLAAGKPFPLGATWDGLGVNFALFSANATKVELCIFDDAGERELERIELPEYTDEVWHGYCRRPGPERCTDIASTGLLNLRRAIGSTRTSF